MKITKYVLMVAIIMSGLTCVWFGVGFVATEQQLCKRLLTLHEEGFKNMQVVQDMVGHYHKQMYIKLAFAAWLLILSGLLIFAIRRLPKSE
jgi:hypothetical protein